MNTEEEAILMQQVSDLTEQSVEKTLRPQLLNEYIGQAALKKELRVYIKAAKTRQESLDHVLLYGPPGLGKTTLAMIIANEMEVGLKTTSGPAIEKTGDLLALLNELEPGDILFIDEIHRLPTQVEEMLYSAMEDFFVDIVIGQGPTAHPVHFPLPPFTLIGATTRAGMLSAPLRDRFGIMAHMEYYQAADLKEIVRRTANIFHTSIIENGAYEIALRSRGTPRIANRLFRRVRDFAQVASKEAIDKHIVDEALKILHVDKVGLDIIDVKLLTTMIVQYQGGPVGINTLAANIGEEVETLETMYEPYLMQTGFIQRTARGRIATDLAYRHLGYTQQNMKE
ncbi:Holliday junction DNA helicase RuvB [Weissella beninensis]|uniref:Holliday junction branch migration complex subunit RuvB n=1 Tax=Periweissella beninensis TaxID=504936 RepID=A0ABT0VHU0_9LACO|nr:Holliday junction branch migration DNA helicase RuvB [Periweissella beninensis]MBM7544037.1 Holliday junction DNA helicase RuvB [Periweissella beninensis]MCM2437406.1 Holliday junction branch migration DNA helicase RuvB [Periweissella beninensis]